MSSNNFNFVVRNGLVVNGAFTANSTVVNAATINAQSVALSSNVIVGSNVLVNTTSISVDGAFINASTFRVGNTTANLSFSSGFLSLNGINVNDAIANNADIAYSNAIAIAANATNITSGTLATARLPATVNVATAVNVGANVGLTTSLIRVGNTTVNVDIQAGSITINNVNVNTAITSNASAAFSNATAYANSVASNAYSNAASLAQSVASQAYTNAVTIASNATNITSGTLATARLPATVNVATVVNVGANVSINTTAVSIADGNTVFANTSFIRVGNTTVNTVLSSGSLTINGVNVNTSITSNASAAFTNATTFSANATNLTNGTVPVARLSGTYAIDISGTANNATNLGGQAASFYTNATNISTGTLNSSRLTGTYNISISGTANNATNLGGQAASFYTNATNISTGTLNSSRLTGTYAIDISGTANTANNATNLNGQAASYYTDIPSRLGYTPVNRAGDTAMTGNFSTNGTSISVGRAEAGEKLLQLYNNNRQVYWYLTADGTQAGLFDVTNGLFRYVTNTSGDLSVRGNVIAYASDARLKTNIRSVTDTPLEDLKKISGYRFEWREDGPQSMRGTDVGLLAQEVEKVLPEAVTHAPFDDEYKTLKMNQQLTALLVEAIKELTLKVEDLEKRLGDR